LTIVSNASPIISLAAAGYLDVLPQLYGRITIPEAVWREAVDAGADRFGSEAIASADWLTVDAVSDTALVQTLYLDLGAGEAEAIALAVEQDATLLLIDERRGRKVADRLGLDVSGTLGSLLEAKAKEILPEVKSVLDDLVLHAGFYLSRRLYRRVIEAAGE
jgi:predicted nucleic acid-binding protein